MADDKTGNPPPGQPRETYIPKPPSKEEVDQVSREQAMVTDDWTGEPAPGDGSGNETPPGKGQG